MSLLGYWKARPLCVHYHHTLVMIVVIYGDTVSAVIAQSFQLLRT
jgi:hypothetical protein